MRFKASIDNNGNIVQLLKIVVTLSKITKTCVLRLAPTKIYFVLQSDVSDAATRVWSEISVASVFSTYKIQSTQENNEILVEVSLDLLGRALKAAASSDDITLRIMKRNDIPHFAFDTILKPQPRVGQPLGRNRVLSQYIPIAILHHSLNDQYHEPPLPEPEVSIFMPSLRILKSVIERMKGMGSHLDIAANNKGEFCLRVASDMVEIRTHFKDLQNPTWKEGFKPKASQVDPAQFTVAKIGIKHFSQFLHGHQVNATNVICSIVTGKAVILFLIDANVSLTYLIPVVP